VYTLHTVMNTCDKMDDSMNLFISFGCVIENPRWIKCQFLRNFFIPREYIMYAYHTYGIWGTKGLAPFQVCRDLKASKWWRSFLLLRSSKNPGSKVCLTFRVKKKYRLCEQAKGLLFHCLRHETRNNLFRRFPLINGIQKSTPVSTHRNKWAHI